MLYVKLGIYEKMTILCILMLYDEHIMLTYFIETYINHTKHEHRHVHVHAYIIMYYTLPMHTQSMLVP